ncbi:MAG: MATE family efflux transporter [Clostridia bacterium]
MDKRVELMENSSIPKAVTRLAVPSIAGMLVMAIYNTVDALYVSRLGESAIGAVSIALPLLLLISAIGLAFGVGSGSYISRMLGEKNGMEANRAASTAFFTSMALGLLFTISGLLFIQPILYAFGATDSIMVYAKDYASILLMFCTFQILNMTLNNTLRSEGSAFRSMIGMGAGALLNIALDPLFIFTFNMGVTGAAVATVISQMISFLILFQCYLRKKSLVRISYRFFTAKKYLYVQIMKIGIPTFLRQALQSFSVALLNVAARPYGDAAIASIGVVGRVIMISMCIIFGFSQGFQPVAGFNYGARNYIRLKKATWFAIRTTTLISVLSGLVFYFFSSQIMMAFNATEEMLFIGNRAFKFIATAMPLIGFTITINVLFQALGHARGALILSISRQGLFYIPLILILPTFFGLTGLFIVQPLAEAMTFVAALFLAYGIRKKIGKMETEKPPAVLI